MKATAANYWENPPGGNRRNRRHRLSGNQRNTHSIGYHSRKEVHKLLPLRRLEDLANERIGIGDLVTVCTNRHVDGTKDFFLSRGKVVEFTKRRWIPYYLVAIRRTGEMYYKFWYSGIELRRV